MSATPPEYEVYAVKYARRDGMRQGNFLFKDPHDGPGPLDYFVWAIVGGGRTIVVDLGFDAVEAQRRGRQLLRCPSEGLRMIGIEAERVEDVIVTHMHYDHCGNLSKFPKARLHLQEREMRYATGRHMAEALLREAYSVESVTDLVRALYEDRVGFVEGTTELAPGVSLHHVGGHTDGLQVVRVWTRRGWVVLASDAAHLYENKERINPFPIVFSVGDMLDGFRTLDALAASPRHVVPGHDPLVMQRYPAPSRELEGIVARLDADPAD